MEKRLLHALLKRLQHGALSVTYPDDETVTYGAGTPYLHLHFKNLKAIRNMLKNLSLGFGEGYSKGDIEIEGDLEGAVRLASENKDVFASPIAALGRLKIRKNTRQHQKDYIAHHYDIGNDFYSLWLDKSMLYSCAYFQSPSDTLEVAQQHKIEHILRKLQLQKGHKLLDVGSGWGTLLITAAQKYGVTGHGVTLSEEQLAFARRAASKANVADKVSFELANYQDLPDRSQRFDRIVSVGMFEHVGRGNHRDYYRTVEELLKPNGLSVLHTITQQIEGARDPWIDKYIFPGGYLPSNREIMMALPDYNFRLIDYENLRLHYAMTLEAWLQRYEQRHTEVVDMFDEEFYRMWRLWLASSAGSFRYGDLDLSQYVFTKGLQNELSLTREFLYR